MTTRQKWPADRVERRPITGLVPYARNARTHSDEQVAQIAASMREWGWTTPVLIDEDGGIIAGHGRILAAQSLGYTEVPVMVAEGWTDAQKRAYVIADNKLAMNAGWDNALLAVEFAELGGLDFDLNLTGFTLDEISDLTPDGGTSGLIDEDDAPPPQSDPVTSTGDVWLCGSHRILCGDSTRIDHAQTLLGGRR